MIDEHVRDLLELAVSEFEQPKYIPYDPISIPHGFDDPADQEIIGLFAAILAWGQRKTMLRKLEELCERMSYRPAQFIRDFDVHVSGAALAGFKHRTFTSDDAIHLCRNLSIVLRTHKTLEHVVAGVLNQGSKSVEAGIETLSAALLTAHAETPRRLSKHLARPSTGSACKRLSMYFRWMVRPGPFDLGIWRSIDRSLLLLPLDVHSGRHARSLGLLSSPANNWKSVLALTDACRSLSRVDPSRYDFALFGLGAYPLTPALADAYASESTTPPTA